MLAATVALSAVALWAPQDAPAAASDAQAKNGPKVPPVPGAGGISTHAMALPSHLPERHLEPARFDPFVGVVPPPPPPPKPLLIAAAPPPPPPAPEPPPLAYRYLGRMTDPSGTQRVYLAKADTAVAVTVGSRLDEGYVVEAIEPAEIRLHYPPLGARAAIPVPPEPDPPSR